MPGQKINVYQTTRAVEWWEYKLSPIFATIYATALLLNVSIASLWPVLVLSLLALIPGAAYVSVINDLTDLKDDLASGKNNRLVGRSRLFIAVTLACCVLPGVLVATHLRNDKLPLTLYLANWAAFSLYSLPPVRLKNRGFPGILADAAGVHMFADPFGCQPCLSSNRDPDYLSLVRVGRSLVHLLRPARNSLASIQ
jgi:4-hydroxybenzoate polyprenyltransferase